MTQPPLTQAIAGLEQALGVRLFDRTKRSVVLTPAGMALVSEARDLLARAHALPERARGCARPRSTMYSVCPTRREPTSCADRLRV